MNKHGKITKYFVIIVQLRLLLTEVLGLLMGTFQMKVVWKYITSIGSNFSSKLQWLNIKYLVNTVGDGEQYAMTIGLQLTDELFASS